MQNFNYVEEISIKGDAKTLDVSDFIFHIKF